jgi:hypothetical protein
MLPHLPSAWHVDQAIMSEEERLVVIRFGRDSDPDCMKQDEVLYRIAERVKNYAVIYLCDLDQVPDFKPMYVQSCDPAGSLADRCWQVRALRCYDHYVLLSQQVCHPVSLGQTCTIRPVIVVEGFHLLGFQAHDVRLWYRQQQQAQLGVGG